MSNSNDSVTELEQWSNVTVHKRLPCDVHVLPGGFGTWQVRCTCGFGSFPPLTFISQTRAITCATSHASASCCD